MTINISIQDVVDNLHPKITVLGVGGSGGNAVNNMINANLEGVDFLIANTDAQALQISKCPNKIQLGLNSTKGLGAGMRPDIGRQAAEEAIQDLSEKFDGSHMLFIAAGMGGGTGTGAAPVVAQMAREMGILTVGVVTLPFNFEGPKRMNRGLAGITELRKACDTVINIPNQKLMSIVDKSTTVVEAFKLADSILHHASKGISDLINVHGLINLDFADVETVMKNMGEAVMGTGTASGEERAVLASQQAISSPLLDNATISGAQGVLVNITGGANLTLIEVDQATSIIFEEAGKDANIIFGAVIDPSMSEEIMVTVIATGFNRKSMLEELPIREEKEVTPTQTRILAEKEDVPLHQQTKQEDLSNNDSTEESKPTLFFDDTNPPIYGNDLDVPAFIRRQHD